MKRFLIVWICVMRALSFCPVCAEGNGIRVTVTDFPCYDFVRAVLGTEEGITLLIRPGAEVHSFDPSPADLVAVTDADLFVRIGGESEIWTEGLAAKHTLTLIDCVDAIGEETIEGMQIGEVSEESGEKDEHIWLSPSNAMLMVRAIEEELCLIEPANAERWHSNANAYCTKIDQIDTSIRTLVSGAARKELIFADRFPFLYLVREYGLEYRAAFPGCAAETEPSAKTVMYLIDCVIRERIPVIYVIEMSTGTIARTIAEETGARILTMHSIQNVTADEFGAGETWISLMEKNIEALREGLE